MVVTYPDRLVSATPYYIAAGVFIAVGAGGAAWVASGGTFPFEKHLAAIRDSAPQPKSFPVPNADVKTDRLPASAPEPQALEPGPISQFIETVNLYPSSLSWNGSPAPVESTTGKRPPPSRLLLDDAQIISLKSRLRLTLRQQKYWPRLEKTMRAAMNQLYDYQKRGRAAGEAFDMNSPAVQNFIATSKEFLALLRDDQKEQIKSLAHVAGVESLFAELSSPAAESAKRSN
jgi:hypothetical protein